MNQFSCTCADGFEGANCQTGRSLSFRLQRHKCCSNDILSGEHLSAKSEHNFNTGYQSSMSDVTILHFEENWHRRTFKQAVNIHRELDFIKASVIAILVKMAVLAVMNWTSSVALV